MLIALYLFGRQIGKDNNKHTRIPILVEEQNDYCSSCSCSEGLKGLAHHLETIVGMNYDPEYIGKIPIVRHAPVIDMAYSRSGYEVYELSEKQRQSFQNLLSKRIKISWVDHRQNEDFIKDLAFYKKYFKDSEK